MTNKKSKIIQLNIEDKAIAESIVNIQKASYRVEAEIIGTDKIPTLYDTRESIQKSEEVYIGYFEANELVAILSYKFEFGILDIHRLAVLPDHFKKGIACNLLKRAVESNPDAYKVIVATGSKNTPAIRLYEKLGFKIIRSFLVEDEVSISQLELEGNLNFRCDVYRSEEEVINLIIDFASVREDVNAVLLNGSRVNENVMKDRFQDYDVTCVVDNPSLYLANQGWIDHFGCPLIKQQNDFEVDGHKSFIFLIQFSDGNRLDINFIPLEKVHMRSEDTLEKVLYDPKQILGNLPLPSDVLYRTVKPSESEVLNCINNIMWCTTNVVKGICRQEFNYVKRMQEQIIRADLNKLMRWHIASEQNWTVNTGVFGKWMQSYLTTEEWESYIKSCQGQNYEEMWAVMLTMLDLVNYYGVKLTQSIGIEYPHKDEAGIREHVRSHEKYYRQICGK